MLSLRNGLQWILSRWRLLPLWTLKLSRQHPMLPRIVIAVYGVCVGAFIFRYLAH